MQSSLDKLQTAVGNLGNGNVTQNLQAVGTAIAGDRDGGRRTCSPS